MVDLTKLQISINPNLITHLSATPPFQGAMGISLISRVNIKLLSDFLSLEAEYRLQNQLIFSFFLVKSLASQTEFY